MLKDAQALAKRLRRVETKRPQGLQGPTVEWAVPLSFRGRPTGGGPKVNG